MTEPSRPRSVTELRVLGPLEIRRAGEVVPLRSARQRALLARLLLDAGRVVPLDAIVDALWGDEPPADPRNAVQTYVARLREVLTESVGLITREPGYLLDVGSDEVDVLRFEELLDQAGQLTEQPAASRGRLDEALNLWRGPAYAEFADGFAHPEALRLAERRLVALEQRAACRLELGEAAEVAGELEALAGEHPWRERFVELHMRALSSLGRDREALAVYRAYRELLAEEAGLDPSDTLVELEGTILRGELVRPARATAPRRQEPSLPATGVPLAVTSLVGREREIAHTQRLLDESRLVTLIGPGGVGKTRIAAEAAEAADAAGAEVAWVELAPVADPTAVVHVVAAAAGVDLAGAQPRPEALLAAVAGRSLLMVLDNCEHLVDTVAPLADEMQRKCPGVRVLATSRERLAVTGERVLPVAPLGIDERDGETPAAVRLFLDRAAAVTGLDTLGPTELVGEICRELDGLPLAIELAAARAGVLPLDELLAALRGDSSAAVGRQRSQPERHRDLWAVVDWSYRLLDAPEQRLFERLSVFAGTFGIDEAHLVCAPHGQSHRDTAAQLAGVAERSLLAGPLPEPVQAPGRYRLLRPVRAFARQRLADRGEEQGGVADRHAVVMVAAAEEAAGPPLSDGGRRWIEAALDDLRAARRRLHLTGDVGLVGRLVAALYWFDFWRPGSEVMGWAEGALAITGLDEQSTAPQVYAAAATAAWSVGDLDRAEQLAAHGATLGAGPDDPARTHVYAALADVAFFAGRLDDAETAFREAARLAQQGDDIDSEVNALAGVALARAYGGRVDEAVTMAEMAVREAAGAGPAVRAFSWYVKGECLAEAEPEAAVTIVEEAAVLASDCGAWFVEGVARLTAASVRGRIDEPADVVAAYADLLRHWQRSGNWTQQWTTLRNLVELLVRLEVDDAAVAIAAAADSQETAAPSFGTESARLDRALTAARGRLGRERFEAARDRGHRLHGHEIVDLALDAIEAIAEPERA